MVKKERNIILTIALLLLAVAPLMFSNNYHRFVLCNILINVILVMALNFILGFAGQVFLGTVGFFAIGSYVTALLTTRLGFTFWQAVPWSIVVTSCFSLVLGLPTLKLSGFYLALMSHGFIVVTVDVLKNWTSITNGVWGIANIPRPVVFGHSFGKDIEFYYLAFMVTAALAFLAVIIEDSRFGRAFKVVRDDELAGEVIGINPISSKLLAFVISGAYVGIAGALYASFQRFISPDIFSAQYNSLLMCMLVIGGLGSVPGSVVGATLMTTLTEMLRFMRERYLTVYAIIIIVTLVYQPTGLMGALSSIYHWLKLRFSKTALAARGGNIQ